MPKHPDKPAQTDSDGLDEDPNPDTGPSAFGGAGDAPAYEVGYRKPPKNHRFQPGQSGNPRGGKRGPRKPTVDQILQAMGAVFSEPVEAKSGEKVIKLPRIVAATHAMMQKAMKGDVQAMRIALSILDKLHGLPVVSDGHDPATEAAASADIEAYLRRRLNDASKNGGGQP